VVSMVSIVVLLMLAVLPYARSRGFYSRYRLVFKNMLKEFYKYLQTHCIFLKSSTGTCFENRILHLLITFRALCWPRLSSMPEYMCRYNKPVRHVKLNLTFKTITYKTYTGFVDFTKQTLLIKRR
jgi:hypothetical protein